MPRKTHKLKLLPPKIDYSQLIKEMSDANRALGELKGLLANIPNPDLLTKPLITKEAVASSKIEGAHNHAPIRGFLKMVYES